MPYGESLKVNDVKVSLHPAGHVLGSAQVRIEHKGEVWVVSGDYKVEPDPTCAAFEPVPCHTFITESTFGLPVYKWVSSAELFADINAWWSANAAQGRASVLFCYSFGKAQRLLAGVDSTIGPIVTHGAVEPLNRVYREAGVALPITRLVSDVSDKGDFAKALVIAPPSAAGSTWMKRFGDYSDAFASGWMLIRGARRRRAVDKGFVMSDHADWPGLNRAIQACGASTVYVTHGYVAVMVKWLQEQGLQALSFETKFGEDEDSQ
jgi:putative mRNA 3-end processing factor